MGREVPLEVFDETAVPILISDETGRVEFLNSSAAAAFGVDRAACIGRCCWEVARLRTLAGTPFCREACPLHADRAEERPPPRVSLRSPIASANDGTFEVAVFPLGASRPGRRPILHVLHPSHHADGSAGGPAPVLRRLTPRERQVLGRLSDGMTTDEIAASLYVSPATVRNHVRSILSKLGVHHRIEAILAWLLRGIDR